MDIIKIKEIATQQLANKYSPDYNEKGEKFYHGQRVATLAVKLRQLIYPVDLCCDEILTVAAWFHDILNGTANHCIEGSKLTIELLSPYCTKNELDKIYEIISVHDDRASTQKYPYYIQLHQDADLLDHLGVFDIWRCFTYAIPHDQTVQDILNYMINVRMQKLTIQKDELNFDISKKIYDEKVDFLNNFIERFKIESSGGIWNEKEILK